MSNDALDARGKVDPCSRKLVEYDSFVREGCTTAAVFFGDVGQEEAGRTGRCPGFEIRAMLPTPPGLKRGELVPYELTHRGAKGAELIGDPRGLVSGSHHWLLHDSRIQLRISGRNRISPGGAQSVWPVDRGRQAL